MAIFALGEYLDFNFLNWINNLKKLSIDFSMDFSKVLTPYNYHEWKQAVSNQLMSIGLLRMILGQDLELATSVVERRKWFDRRDKALGFLRSTISNDFLYHIASCTHPHDAWTPLEEIFGKPDRIKKFKLENEIIGLSLWILTIFNTFSLSSIPLDWSFLILTLLKMTSN